MKVTYYKFKSLIINQASQSKVRINRFNYNYKFKNRNLRKKIKNRKNTSKFTNNLLCPYNQFQRILSMRINTNFKTRKSIKVKKIVLRMEDQISKKLTLSINIKK